MELCLDRVRRGLVFSKIVDLEARAVNANRNNPMYHQIIGLACSLRVRGIRDSMVLTNVVQTCVVYIGRVSWI